MMNMTIKAKSSSGEPYNVVFLIQDGRLSVHCNCKAGIFGQLCKHKTELITGDESRLFDMSEKEKLEKLTYVISTSHEVKAIASSIAESEKLIKQEQAKIMKLKKEFGAKLQNGIEVQEDTQ